MAGVGEDLDLSVEERLAQLRQQVVEDRASREAAEKAAADREASACLLYTSPSPRDGLLSRMPSSA